MGDGENRWPAVHRLDAARLFRLALESAPAGSVLHAIGEEGVPTRRSQRRSDAASTCQPSPSRRRQAGELFGWIGGFFALDVPASAELTKQRMGWEPTHQGLLADLAEGHYYAVAA